MRLSDVLSKPITTDYVQIENFLGSRKLKTGNYKKIAVGKVALNFYCNNCGDQRTFYSREDLFCICVNEKTVSIYKLFGELNDVVHGDYDEDEALQKFDAFYRLVTGVLEKIKTNQELMDAIGTLGWHTGGEENE